MEHYPTQYVSRPPTANGCPGACPKNFIFQGDYSNRNWVDMNVLYQHDFKTRVAMTISRAQAILMISELSRYFDLFPLAGVAPAVNRKPPAGKQAYKGNRSHTWEKVLGTISRLRVPGGWLYADLNLQGEAANFTFVAVPEVVGYKI